MSVNVHIGGDDWSRRLADELSDLLGKRVGPGKVRVESEACGGQLAFRDACEKWAAENPDAAPSWTAIRQIARSGGTQWRKNDGADHARAIFRAAQQDRAERREQPSPWIAELLDATTPADDVANWWEAMDLFEKYAHYRARDGWGRRWRTPDEAADLAAAAAARDGAAASEIVLERDRVREREADWGRLREAKLRQLAGRLAALTPVGPATRVTLDAARECVLNEALANGLDVGLAVGLRADDAPF